MAIGRAAVVAASMCALTAVPVGAAGAHPAGSPRLSSFDQQLVNSVNGQRQLRGLSVLKVSAPLTSIATGWARQMAASGRSHDNPNLRAQVTASCPHWKAVGEVVDEAGESTELALWRDYYDNTAERQQLMQPSLTDIGVHTVTTNQHGAQVRWNVIDVATNCE
ncbi:MAG TPA: CAP domain-containing protein [Mycobacteriales bacterium]|nr:CAP domain-containing protein [Mycobacteriales bacterium]